MENWEKVITSKATFTRCACGTEYWEKSKNGKTTIQSLRQAGQCYKCGLTWTTACDPAVYETIKAIQTTPYRKLFILCEVWMDRHPEIDAKYPSLGMDRACREYRLQADIEDYYSRANAHDPYPKDSGEIRYENVRMDDQQDWYQRVLDYAIAHESAIVRLLKGVTEPTEYAESGEQTELEF